MTQTTNSNYVKPRLWLITVPVMIFFCWMITVMASQSIRTGQFACFNSTINSILGSYRFRMAITVFAGSFLMNNFAFSTLRVSFSSNLAFFASLIFTGFYEVAYFAIRTIANWATVSLIKFWKQFDLFTSTTSFCYSLLRHNRFLSKRLRLEPAAAHTVVGLLYCNRPNSAWQLI